MALPEWDVDRIAEHHGRWSAGGWPGNTITYSFPTSAVAWLDVSPLFDISPVRIIAEAVAGGLFAGGFNAFDEGQEKGARLVLDMWSEVAAINFVDRGHNSDGVIRYFSSTTMVFTDGLCICTLSDQCLGTRPSREALDISSRTLCRRHATPHMAWYLGRSFVTSRISRT